MAKTKLQKLEGWAARSANTEFEGQFPIPEFSLSHYAQRIALGADEETFRRFEDAIISLITTGQAPQEIIEVADTVREIRK